MLNDVLSHAIQEVERCERPDLAPAIAKALAVMKALRFALGNPAGLDQALANLDVSALTDEEGWPQIRYTIAPGAKRAGLESAAPGREARGRWAHCTPGPFADYSCLR